jgi:glycine/D-amino acid oxidase-like deaminating enzyme
LAAKSDVLVIGSGVFGLACAWELGRAGRSVTVLDRAPLGTEASGFALGRLDPLLKGSGSTGETERGAPKGQIGRPGEQAELAMLSYNLHRELTADIEETSSIDLQVDTQPTLQLFFDEAERRYAAQAVGAWTAQGFPSQLVSQGDIKKMDARYAAPEHGGALIEGPYFIDSLRFTHALAACARAAGVRFETAHVSEIEPGVVTKLHTDQGHYEAETVVVAAGPWSAGLLEPLGVKLPVRPSKGEILRLRPLRSGPFGAHLHGPCSVVHKRDGLVWVAATAASDGFNREPTQEAERKLLANARLMMPEAAESPVERHTVCFRPATPDDMPVAGNAPLHGNVLVASGGGGLGIMHCLLIGRQVAGMVERGAREPEIASIALSRFG